MTTPRPGLSAAPDNSLRPFVLIFILLATLLSAMGYGIYRHEKTAIKEEKYNDLKAIAELKTNQISAWRRERLSDARLHSSSRLFREAVARLRSASGDDAAGESLPADMRLVRDMYGYENVILAALDGRVLLSLNPRLSVLEAKTREMVTLAVSFHAPVFGDLFRCPDCGGIHLDVAAPIVDTKNQPLAVLILRTDPEQFLFPLVQSWPLPSKSAETLLVRREGDDILFLNSLRHRADPPLSHRIPISISSLPAARAATGETGVFEGKDYRGIPVLSDTRHVPDSSWFMVAKMDADEIFARVRQRAYFIGLLTLALVALSGAGVAFIYKAQGKRMFQALFRAERERAEAKEKFKTTLYSIGDAVITADVTGNIRELNPVAEKLTGWSEAEARGKSAETVFKIIDETTRTTVDNPVQKVLEKGLVVGLANHTLLITKDGGEIPIADSGAPIRDEAGEITGVVLVFRDQIKEREIEKLILVRLKLLEYATTHSLEDLLRKTLDEVGALTGSPIGFYHFVENDQKTLSLQAWSTRTLQEFCTTKGNGMHYSIDEAGVWVDCVRARKPVIHNNYESLPHKKGMPEGHAEVVRELVVPILREDRVVAILGVGNKSVDYTEKDGEIVAYLADVAWEITIRKRAEESLRVEKENLNAIMAASPVGIMVFDGKEDIVYVNSAAKRMFQTPLDALLPKKCGDLLGCANRHENDEGCGHSSQCPNCSFLKALRQVLADGQGVFDQEAAVIRETAEGRKQDWYNFSVASVLLGGKRHAILALADISLRKQAEEEIRKNESRFRQLYENSPVAYQSLDARGHILEVNASWLTDLGYAREEVIDQWFGDFLAGDGPALFPARFEAFKAAGEVHGVEFDLKTRKGEIISVNFEGRVSWSADGSFERTHCIFVNITEQKQREEMLRRLTSRQEAILSAVPDMIMEVDMNKTYTWANAAGLKFFGDDVIGRAAADYFVGDQDAYDRVQPLFDGREDVLYLESRQQRKDGKKRLLAWWCRVLKDDSGGVTGALSSARDITEQREMEDQLQQAQKMESIGRLAGGVAHDFNNMLGVILGHAELVLEKIPLDDPLREDVTEIFDAGRRSTEITRQLLAFARRQTIAPRTIDLNETVEGMLKMLRRLIGEDINLAWEPGPNLWPVNMDPAQVDQVLANLLVNARDAIDGVGKITIETDNVVLDETYCADRPGFIPGDYVVLAVSDNGCGMDTETLHNIFEPFFTTKGVGEGTGLGLATVYGIVKQNDGFINVYSEPGQGTTFKIYLPRHLGESEAVEIQTTDEIPAGHGETVLVVEDEPAVLKLTRKILTGLGYTVLTALNPEAALKAAEEQENIDLLMTDVIMPGMNGRDLSEKLKVRYPNLRVLFMSGYTADVIAHHGILDSGVHFIQKPFNRRDLARKVRETLRMRNERH